MNKGNRRRDSQQVYQWYWDYLLPLFFHKVGRFSASKAEYTYGRQLQVLPDSYKWKMQAECAWTHSIILLARSTTFPFTVVQSIQRLITGSWNCVVRHASVLPQGCQLLWHVMRLLLSGKTTVQVRKATQEDMCLLSIRLTPSGTNSVHLKFSSIQFLVPSKSWKPYSCTTHEGFSTLQWDILSLQNVNSIWEIFVGMSNIRISAISSLVYLDSTCPDTWKYACKTLWKQWNKWTRYMKTNWCTRANIQQSTFQLILLKRFSLTESCSTGPIRSASRSLWHFKYYNFNQHF